MKVNANPMPRRALQAVACAALLALAGCASMAPVYERPALPVQPSVGGEVEGNGIGVGSGAAGGAPMQGAQAQEQAAALAALQWQQVFTDPRLQQVIDAALANSRDLRVSLLNVEKAQAQYRIQSASLFPSVAASASQTNARSAVVAGGEAQAQTSRSGGLSVGFTSWELDLFGRVRSLKDEALENYLSLAQTGRSTRISLIAQVASNWLNVGAYGQRLELARETLASQRKTLELTQAKHQFGVASAVDVSQVQTSVESARADVASYTTALEQARHALDLAVGSHVADALLPRTTSTGDVALARLPDALSSEVLLQRPDVMAAEHALKAANADIGAARAAFFPKVSLSASAGYGSDTLGNLFDAGTRTWSFVPSISLPIFNAGSLKASLDVAQIEKNIYVAQYEKSIQSAFGEVADALSARRHMAEQLDAQQALVQAAQTNYDLSDARWRNGVNSYLQALDAQRSLYSARQSLISLQLSDLVNRVTLYKVLGAV
ncbi:efflux transporter outer membrane subunit [Comamonas terrigena]|uniref:efflux transporter outer membrane subunit n=1 Tax=Comamonas terrigena TaxID=32013 RepID=UPI00244876FE|nr:efflux transporter outer membrane subunit [Comamonas terrigena]MDH1701046.1 efflux transporter outer membrane subunit [Comamonas terrigena]